MKKYLLFAVLMIVFLMAGCEGKEDDDVKSGRTLFGGKIVGDGIGIDDITDFYDTVSDINYDAYYQRYRFYVEDGKYYFFHETRERPGDYGPCTEDDTTAIGTMELTEEQWEEFFELISGGKVKAREDDGSAGDSGPWFYLYWNGDKGKYQEYSFKSTAQEADFEAYCNSLASQCGGGSAPDLEVTSVSYSPGYSDMDGASHYNKLLKTKYGKWIVRSDDCDDISEPLITTVYEISDEEFSDFEEFIKESGILGLSYREAGNEFCDDYSEWSIWIEYKDLDSGTERTAHINEYKKYSDKDYELIDEFVQYFKNMKVNMIDSYEGPDDFYDDKYSE